MASKQLSYNKLIFSLLIGFFNSVNANEALLPKTIEIIKESSIELTQSDIIKKPSSSELKILIYDLDTVDRFEGNINKLLPGNESQAAIALDNYIKKVGKKKFERQLIEAYQGLMFAMKYQLTRYPAIIFDQQYVVYGVTDLQEALKYYKRWKAK